MLFDNEAVAKVAASKGLHHNSGQNLNGSMEQESAQVDIIAHHKAYICVMSIPKLFNHLQRDFLHLNVKYRRSYRL